MRIVAGTLLLCLTVLSGAAHADPWRDESGHGRWRGGHPGETPAWRRGHWDRPYAHRGSVRIYRFGHFAPPPFAYRGYGPYVGPPVHFRWDHDRDFDDYREWQEELRERREDWWEEQREREEDWWEEQREREEDWREEQREREEDWREELRERREEARERWRDRFDD